MVVRRNPGRLPPDLEQTAEAAKHGTYRDADDPAHFQRLQAPAVVDRIVVVDQNGGFVGRKFLRQLPFDLFVDAAIRKNDRIAFNAGSLTNSVIMGVDDYLRVAEPTGEFGFSVTDSVTE